MHQAILKIGPEKSYAHIARELEKLGFTANWGGKLWPRTVARYMIWFQIPHGVAVKKGDARSLRLTPSSIDLILTSPPYAMQRSKDYPSVTEADYVDFTLEWTRAFKRALKPHGSLIIIIRPHVRDGEQRDYVERTVAAMRADGWKLCDTLIWDKMTAMPLGDKARLKRAYEPMFWFSLGAKPFCDPLATGRASPRLGMRYTRHSTRSKASVRRYGISRGTDVFRFAPGGDPLSDHNAQFPIGLAAALISTFCPLNGLVYDPFVGAGTTLLAAAQTGRRSKGVDVWGRAVEMTQARLERELLSLWSARRGREGRALG